VVLGAVVTLVGVWAFMSHIHGQEPWLMVLVWAFMPLATLARRFEFFNSNVVYWASIVGGFALWSWVGYRVFGVLDRRGAA
jgi:hypothetical protein